jgi:hypothetical protein
MGNLANLITVCSEYEFLQKWSSSIEDQKKLIPLGAHNFGLGPYTVQYCMFLFYFNFKVMGNWL